MSVAMAPAATLVGFEEDELDLIVDKLRVMIKQAGLSADDLQRSFEHFDSNFDGKVDEREFRAGLYELGFDMTKEQ